MPLSCYVFVIFPCRHGKIVAALYHEPTRKGADCGYGV